MGHVWANGYIRRHVHPINAPGVMSLPVRKALARTLKPLQANHASLETCDAPASPMRRGRAP